MASVTRRLVFGSARCSRSIRARAIAPQQQWHRSLSSTVPRQEDAKDNSKAKAGPAKKDHKTPTIVQKDPLLTTAEVQAPKPEIAHEMVKEDPPRPTKEQITAAQLKKLMEDLEALDDDKIAEAERKGKRGMPFRYRNDDLERDEDFEIERETGKLGFWAEGEESLGPDEDYYADDITSDGHGRLEEQRDLREYARLIAWELPLLNQLARPFELPTEKTPFRFRYTSYLGESHPAANKVVVEFAASDMPNLTQVQRNKLIKLAGPRYNPDTDIIKMSCELFDTLPQNKRFLGDTISKLLAEARNGEDTFDDVPFDFRHHKPKVRHEWPREWNLTPERKKYLAEKRAKMLQLDEERAMNGTLVDGTKIIETSLPFAAPVQEPVMVGSGAKRLR